MSWTLSLQVMSGKIWIKLGRTGNSELVATSIRCPDEEWPSDIDDLKDLCQKKLQECEGVGKTQMAVFADDQASQRMDERLKMKDAKSKYGSIGGDEKPFVIIISASGDCFLCDETMAPPAKWLLIYSQKGAYRLSPIASSHFCVTTVASSDASSRFSKHSQMGAYRPLTFDCLAFAMHQLQLREDSRVSRQPCACAYVALCFR